MTERETEIMGMINQAMAEAKWNLEYQDNNSCSCCPNYERERAQGAFDALENLIDNIQATESETNDVPE